MQLGIKIVSEDELNKQPRANTSSKYGKPISGFHKPSSF